MYYDAGSAFKEMATAPATRIEEAVTRLGDERTRRLAAEATAKEAATSLAEERTVADRLRHAMHRAEAELADVRREKEEAVRALKTAHELSRKERLAREHAEAEVAIAKGRITEAEAKLAQVAREATAKAKAQLAELQQVSSREKEELQEVKTALLATNRTIDELRATLLEPMVPDSGEPVAENSPCVLAVQCKISFGHKGPTAWPAANLDRLCRGAEASEEPAKCFDEIMREKVNWGAGTTWAKSNALALCGGTHSARRTLDCFKTKIASDRSWRIAIKRCSTNR
jgi:hypothetical protein